MSKQCVVVYDNPSMWKSDVLYSDGAELEVAKRELCPFNLRDNNTERDIEPFTDEEVAAIMQAEPTNGSILVREENVGGYYRYRKIVAGGELVPGFCDLHFNLDENKAKVRVIEFLANLGASNIMVAIKRSTKETLSSAGETEIKVDGGIPVASGSVDGETKSKESSLDEESVAVEGGSEKNEPNFPAAHFMLETNAWFRDCFAGLYERVRSGRTHGMQTETIEHHVVRDFYKNSAFAVGVAVRYKMVKGELQTKVEAESKSHKDETVSLTWSCSFP